MNNPKQGGGQTGEVPCANKDKDNPTQISINQYRNKYCLELYDAAGATAQQQTKFKGEKRVFEAKRCLFNNTEENYRRYRNLEITVGTELLQTTDSLKGNLDRIKKWNGDLAALLKKISGSVKDVKNKFGELNQAGCKLRASISDKCNSSQWRALTGKQSENCKENPVEPHQDCKEAGKIIEELISRPKCLGTDIDSIFQSAADVVGIQIFINADLLDPLQKDLDTRSKEFEKHIAEVMKTRKGDLDKLQDDLVKSVKEITKAALDRNSQRSDFEGYKDAVHYLCCPPCPCIVPKEPSPDPCDDDNDRRQSRSRDAAGNECYENCETRLQTCEQWICEICDEVEEAFCCDAKPKTPDPNNPRTHRGCCDD
jgi:hypothetical protein